ncbi:O-antigen ligase family protein [Sphingomonas changnyeongensis]|nr:O-antigen ligase family protein [Sphingomonas changnyeongensis]
MGLAEAYNEQILWARHIPSFLAVTDESVQRTLSGDFREGAYRVTGTYTVSLALAEYLALVTPFVLQKIAERPGLGAKLLYAGINVLLLVIIILTRSRLGIVGWLAAHMVWGCIWAYRRWRSDKSDVLGPALAFAIPALALAFGVAMFTVDAIRFRTIGGGSTGFSDQARWEQLDGTWPLVLRNPIGYGTGQSGEVLGFRTPGGQVTVDTYIVTLLLDYGVIGFCLFLGIFGLAVATMLRISLRPRGREIDIAMPVCAALVAYLVVRLVFAQDDNAPLVYMMLGLASAIAFKAKRQDAESAPAPA